MTYQEFRAQLAGEPADPQIAAYRSERTLRNLLKLTHTKQTEAARLFGVPLRTVQGWCLGEREIPPYLLDLIAYILITEGGETK